MDNVDTGLTYEGFSKLLGEICRDAESYKDLLNELDSEIGDGDLGVSVSRGFKAIEHTLSLQHKNISQLLIQSGMSFTNSASSTMGALFGMSMMRAGICIGDKKTLDLESFYKMVSCFEESIIEKGKTHLGEKTMLDSVEQIRLSLEKSIKNNDPVEKAIENAYIASEKGSEATRSMKALKGRSRWLGDQTIGHLDPGAVFISLIMKSIFQNYKKLQTDSTSEN